MRSLISIAVLAFVTGCTGGNSDVDDTDDITDPDGGGSVGGEFLGGTLEVIQDSKLKLPRDLAFNPLVPGELWVVSQGTESVTVLYDVATEAQEAVKYDDDQTGPHFLAKPSGIAFGDNGAMATIHDTDEKTQGANGTPGDFMGPTLWSTERGVFDGGHSSHLDMLHNSPLGTGIAWESGNAYWVFDGYNKSITRYDFVSDHGLGGSDHTDGIIARYIEGEVKRPKSGTPSGLWYDHGTDELYIVDSGNNRVIVLDTLTGERGGNTSPNYDGADQFRIDGAEYRVLIDGESVGLVEPSGIDVHDNTIYISDAGSPALYAFSMEGELLDSRTLDHDINGIAIDTNGDLYFVDPVGEAVLRIDK